MNFSLLIVVFFAFISCERSNNLVEEHTNSNIVYQDVNQEFVMNTLLIDLMSKNNAISTNVDSILSGLKISEFLSSGYQWFDLNGNGAKDIAFEIYNKEVFNLNSIPPLLNNLTVKVIPINVELLDNNKNGFSDAIIIGNVIPKSGKFTNEMSEIGNANYTAEFQGEGERFLGYRMAVDSDYVYGWIRIFCSENNDTLQVIDFAYNQVTEDRIDAGQVN